MAIFKPIKTTFSKLNNISIVEGQFIFVTDTNELFIDKSATERVKVSADFIPEFEMTLGVNSGVDLTYNGNEAIQPGDIQLPREDTMIRIAQAIQSLQFGEGSSGTLIKTGKTLALSTDPDDWMNGNVFEGGFVDSVSFAIRQVRRFGVHHASFRLKSLGDSYRLYCVGRDAAGGFIRINSTRGNDYYEPGDESVPNEACETVHFVVAKKDMSAITPADIAAASPVIEVSEQKNTTSNVFSTSRKGAKLFQTPYEYVTIAEGQGQGVIENMFFAGDLDYSQVWLRVITDGEISVDGSLHELIGLRMNSGSRYDDVCFGTKMFGKTGSKGGIYLNYKIPYYAEYQVQVAYALADNPYVWYTVKTADWHPIIYAGVELPYGAYFRAIRQNRADVQSGEEFELYRSRHNGLILGTILGANGKTSPWYQEGMLRAYRQGSTEPMLLSSGLEDYFYGTYYFRTGLYFHDVCGCSYLEGNEIFAYRFHTEDLLSHSGGGFSITLRNNDLNVEGAQALQGETRADYVWYVLHYFW